VYFRTENPPGLHSEASPVKKKPAQKRTPQQAAQPPAQTATVDMSTVVVDRVPTIEDRFFDMKQRAAMLARFLGASATEHDSHSHGRQDEDAFYGFEVIAQALYTDILAVDAALDRVERGPSSPVLLPAPEVDDDGKIIGGAK
jgi:hypothetical protein